MRGDLVVLFGAIWLASCSKNKDYDDILVIGHAATGLEIMNSVYHDNSREAFEFALSIDGSDGVELDVQMSKDGKLWFYHDSDLESQTDGEGCIPDRTTVELSALKYKSIHQEKLFSLQQLDTALLAGKHLFIDLRHLNECDGTFVPVENIILQLDLQGFDDAKSYTVHCITGYDAWITPLVAAGFNVCFSVYSMDEVTQCELMYPELEGYVVKNKDFTSDEVSSIRSANKKVYIFEVRSPKGIRKALKKHPDGVISDDIRATLIEQN